jgi:type I restriction enzyme S subunit
VITARSGTCPEFYDLVFHTEVYKQQVNRQSTGIVSDRNRLYWDSFKQMQNLCVPFDEQEEIVRFVASETRDLNAAIQRTEREIALIQEYRTRLTADIVTGTLDVRKAAEGLHEGPSSLALDATGADELEEEADKEP